MNRAERLRTAICFGLLAGIVLLLVGRLTYLQVLGKGSLEWADGRTMALNRAAADAQRRRREQLPAPRGTIRDRQGRVLAVDLPVMEVRAEVVFSARDREDPERLETIESSLVRELAHVLAADPTRRSDPNVRNELRQVLRSRIRRAGLDPAGGADVPRRLNFLVATGLDSVEVMEGLRGVEQRMDRLYLHRLRGFRRHYPERDATYGVVGAIHSELIRTAQRYERWGVGGMEAVKALDAGSPGRRLYYLDARAEPFWSGQQEPADAPRTLHSTIDLDLQKAAVRELGRTAEIDIPAAFGSPPKWGALVVVEVPTGDVLAMASWFQGKTPAESSHAAYQQVYEPGSVVKALVFSLALEHGVLDWQRVFNCRPTLSRNGWREPSYGRLVHDVTVSGELTPPKILQRSSNIGAVQVGMRMSRELFQEYLDRFQLGQPTNLGLPAERAGSYPRAVLTMPKRQFWKYTAPSLSIGYELGVSAVQLARAYLTLLSGRQRELRLYRAVELEDRTIPVPQNDLRNQRFLSSATVQTIRSALGDVVSDVDGATGRHLYAMLEEMGMGLDPNGRSLIGGKSGSSEGSGGSQARVRNATFVGFAPVDAPRYLAVAVFQKDDASKFYGGRYAALPVGRVLLRALSLGTGPAVRPTDSRRSGRAPAKKKGGP